MQAADEWQNHLALGMLASKVQQPGWQGVTLQQYARACYTSRAGPEGPSTQPAKLLPFVKLHGTRLKLLATLVGPAAAAAAAARGDSSTASGLGSAGADVPTTAAGAAGGITAAAAGKGALVWLVDQLQLLSRWCFDPSTAAKLNQELLPALQQELQAAAAVVGVLQHQQDQQQKLSVLCNALQQHWRFQGVVAPTAAAAAAALPAAELGSGSSSQGTPRRSGRRDSGVGVWKDAVVLLVEDCVAALRFCNSFCTRPLGPACYSLARGLFRLGR